MAHTAKILKNPDKTKNNSEINFLNILKQIIWLCATNKMYKVGKGHFLNTNTSVSEMLFTTVSLQLRWLEKYISKENITTLLQV